MVTVTRARYTRSRLSELGGNPLAEALPDRLSTQALVKAVAALPDFADEQREWSVADRLMAARRLQACVIPSPDFYRFYDEVHALIAMGYASRNPLEPRVVEWMYDVASHRRCAERTSAESLFVTGMSGVGKTTMLRSILHCFPQVIVHDAYQGRAFAQKQLVYIYVEVPPDASRKGLCLAIFRAVDEALGTNYGSQYGRARTSVDAMQDGIRTICTTHCVGVLIIDEFQNLSVARAGGDKILLQFFDTLSNQARVPIIKIGTPPAMHLFAHVFRSARRAGTGGFFEMHRHGVHDDHWRRIVKIIWRYQWVKNPIPLTEALVVRLYEFTQGLPAMVMRLMQGANSHAIATGHETIDERILDQVYKRDFRLVGHALKALKHGEIGLYEDLMTVKELLEGPGGRAQLKQLLDLARVSGLTGDVAKAVRAFLEDVVEENDLSPSEMRALSTLKSQLESQVAGKPGVSVSDPDEDGVDD